MALTIIFMAIFSIVLAVRNFQNKYNLLFILMVFGMGISMFTIISEIYRSSNYIVPSSYIYEELEYKIFLILSRALRLPLSNQQILRNLGIITYLIAILLFTISFNKTIVSQYKETKQVKKIIRYLFLCTYPIGYYIFYHPKTAFWLFIRRHNISDHVKQNLLIDTVTYIDNFIVILTVLYLIYPIALLLRNFMKNKISFFSEQLLGMAVSLALLNSIFFGVFFTGAFKTSIEDLFQSGFWRYKLAVFIPIQYATLMPVISLIIFLIILFITIKFKTDRMINGIRERAIKKNLNLLNTNLKDVLHSHKNIMFNMKILSEDAIRSYGTPEGKEKLQKIVTLSENHMNSISKALDNIRELKVRTINNNLIDAVENALNEITIPDHISLTKDYHDMNAYCNFDMYHMTQVIINLITNSIDAINSRSTNDNLIKITVDSGEDWIYMSVQDSGCGIPKKYLKKIYSPYFSTKSKQNNWGIGLSYVFRVITSHYGHLKIKSRQGNFTNVEILLPRSNKS